MAGFWKKIAEFWGKIFGPSQEIVLAHLFIELATYAVQGADVLSESGGTNKKRLIELEHKGDKVVQQIHEILNTSSSLMRFTPPHIASLLRELDDILDGMRRVGTLVHRHKFNIGELGEGEKALVEIISSMAVQVKLLVIMLPGKLPLQKVSTIADEIAANEARADAHRDSVQDILATEFREGGSVVLYIARRELAQLLEQITDNAKHCANIIRSMAQKEARVWR